MGRASMKAKQAAGGREGESPPPGDLPSSGCPACLPCKVSFIVSGCPGPGSEWSSKHFLECLHTQWELPRGSDVQRKQWTDGRRHGCWR